MLAGNLASIGCGTIISLVGSLIWPESYDWKETRAIGLHHAPKAFSTPEEKPSTPSGEDIPDEKTSLDREKEKSSGQVVPVVDVEDAEPIIMEDPDLDPVKLQAAYKWAVKTSIGLFLIAIIIIPLPLFFSSYIYPPAGFTAVSFLFLKCAPVI